MKTFKFAVAAGAALLVSACGPSSPKEDSWKSGYYRYEADQGWKPESIHIQCPTRDCPEGVGVVMFVKDVYSKYSYTLTGYEIQRCTGSLISDHEMMTNEHCSEDFAYSRAYFILPKGTGTVIQKLSKATFTRKDKISGIGRDLAIWALEGSANGIKPRRISRQIPAHMENMVSYVINNSQAGPKTDLVLDKRECHTRSRMPFIQGGVDDQSVGLALFDCEIRHGNSGSPVFAAGDLENIQAVANTIWNTGKTDGEKLIGDFGYMFFEPPDYLSQFFAMAERVQCLAILGQPAPAQVCMPGGKDTGAQDPVLDEIADEWYAKEPDSGVVWGARALGVSYKDDAAVKRMGLVMVPYALCYKAQPGTPVAEQVPPMRYYQIGMDKDGRIQSRFLETRNVNAFVFSSGSVQVMHSWSLAPRYKIERNDKITGIKLLLRSEELKPCKPGQFQADRKDVLSSGTKKLSEL